MKSRIIAFVDHEIGRRILEKIISIQGESDFFLVAVVTTQENGQMWWPGVQSLCEREGIPFFRYSEPFRESLNYVDIDWYFLISWKYIVPPILFSHPANGAINLHYSLLPEYRGVYPVNWAIIEGKNTTGVTYHLVNSKIDGGQIVFQKEVPINLSDTARSLQLRLDDFAFELFDEVIQWAIHVSSTKDMLKLEKSICGSYKSRLDFVETDELDLNREYRAIDLFNLLRGKTFRPETKGLYVVDPETGKRIYVSINLAVDE
ncbi:MAG: hypothetical protein EWV78_13450 [Microcystis aeruginosa Ma_MB_F_20061100_S20D]|uniref:Methionyl-tRNA formyltransferase n=1 Tax=Microcystis aeruginosa Ma_MB_F_20061100_S20D TaxID=2486253 RepID=A0A552EIX1_MICAE|nr:MAG: hypothetical protein EWV78_13450 [Microcystis aeruginosa Ma_MB_F_20061100_S20D]